MGSSNIKTTTLKSSELNEFHLMTSFSNETLIKLHDHYRQFSALQTDDGVIDFEEFSCLINKNDKNLTKRIFDAFDTNRDGSINFREFLKFISCFLTGTLEEQINISFKLFSNQETKSIEADVIIELLKDIIFAESSMNNLFDAKTIEVIVNDTFQRICEGENKNSINFEAYERMIKKNPNILNWLRVDLDKIKKVQFKPVKKKITCG